MKWNGLAIAGDMHLRQRTWKNRLDIEGDSYKSLAQVTDFCLDNNHSLLLPGDIFNTQHPDSKAIDIFREYVQRMTGHGLPVWVTQGQHDESDPPWPLAIAGKDAGIQYANGQCIEMLPGLHVYCLDRLSKDAAQAAIQRVPQTANALAVHQLARQAFPMDGVWDFDLDWVPSHVKYVFMADFHKQVEYHTPTYDAWYTGSSHVCEINEEVDKSFLSVTPAGSGFEVERIPLETRRIRTFKAGNETEFKRVLAAISKMETVRGMQPVAVVEFDVDIPDAIPRLRKVAEATPASVWPQPVMLRTDIDEVSLVTESDDVSLRGCLESLVNPGSELFTFVDDLLTRDTATVLSEYKQAAGI